MSEQGVLVDGPVTLQTRLNALGAPKVERASATIDLVLNEAVTRGASDVHFEPTPRGVEVRFRMDGVLQPMALLQPELAPNLVARLKVMAELLTYRVDIPQEGSIRKEVGQNGAEMRVSTFPTIHGEKVVVRLFEGRVEVLELDRLGFLPAQLEALTKLLADRSGALFFTGPSGSGKTTTIYACLRHLVRASGAGRHIVTIEDPVEQVIEGVSQSQVRPGTEFDFARGLRSLLRQDPEVIVIGEVRDRETAAIAIEAALTGHLVISTLHAGSTCGVVSRLLDMGIEPYLLTSSVKGIVNQRLVRRLCSKCRARADAGFWKAPGCEACANTGYHGRLLLAELLTLDEPLRQAILARSDTVALEAAAARPGRLTLEAAAAAAVEQGLTTEQEIHRVFGRP
jgi:type II secretory ATPase GspE/PulE/Tfp pilus assembly ATPase PilB-like protein